MAVYAPSGTCFLMAREIDAEGQLIDPVKVPWATGGMFLTPPGWWHSHHNESEEDAWVLPVQDAALYTYQRTLDIRFAKQEAQEIKRMHERGATFSGQSVLVNDA
ncbi:g9284 [Coccomyxa elongata]